MKETINFSDWEKIDLRVGEIQKIEESLFLQLQSYLKEKEYDIYGISSSTPQYPKEFERFIEITGSDPRKR